jgi:pentapeptide MXKDX repeat protein
MKKSLTALIALVLAFAFGTATLAYAEGPAAKDESTAGAKKDEMKTEKKVKKHTKKIKKKAAKKEKKEEMKKDEMKEDAPK